MKRCAWATSPILIRYHDEKWGVPTHDETELFKMLILEGMQAGLSWEIVLKKEEAYQKAFDDFDYHKIASYDDKKRESLYHCEGIIRNKLKINSIITNAQAFIEVQKSYGSFDTYIWSYTKEPVNHAYEIETQVPAYDDLSTKISQDLKKKGFKFVGPTIIYSYLQAIGIYNDHILSCACYDHVDKKNR